jgi:ubiquitin carboxyl-terminal hydrolase 7
VNQGATCYLNSLLQSLFHSSGFRDAILKTESSTKIVTALKKLFAALILSNDCAVSTKELTTAFGWSNADVFDQHDVQELFCSMTDALSQESPELENFFTEYCKGTQCGTNIQIKCTYYWLISQ